jgi:hypothetical protein
MALLQIKKELNNPTILSSWKTNTDCCKTSWYGVTCFPSNNRVSELTITDENNLITSKFPLSIGNLSYLESLSFYHLPHLTDPIPIESISKLINLKTLIIIRTGMSGPIPNFPAQMKQLTYLDLSSNHFSGKLPYYLYKSPKLGVISFHNNFLTGPIPPSYGYFNNKNTPTLFLSHNQLSGRLPISLARLVNPTVIEFSYNKFEGDASMLFGSNKTTREIYLSQNMFKFDLGKVELPKTLTALEVSHNQIYGKLPLGIENLWKLNVSYNKLCGKIPKGEYMHLSDVTSFFHNKCLCGPPLPNCK